jgi:hypothetical protein
MMDITTREQQLLAHICQFLDNYVWVSTLFT